MTWTAFYEPDGIVLRLNQADLGHPDRPDLWEQLRSERLPRGTIRCMGCSPSGAGGGCRWNPDGAMFLRVHGRHRQAVHYPAEVDRAPLTVEESDLHKALKEYIAASAERHGFRAVTERASSRQRRRADVTIHGKDGLELRVEAQVSTIHPATVINRDRLDRQAGATPMWVTREVAVAGIHAPPRWVDRSPWALIRPAPWQEIAAGTDLDVRGGVKHLAFERCGRRSPLCPERGRNAGRGSAPCGREHAYFDPLHGIYLADLVGAMAAREMVDIRVPRTQGSNHHIVAISDAAEWNAAQGTVEPVEQDPEADFDDELDPKFYCDPRPRPQTNTDHSALNPSIPLYSGITRDPVDVPGGHTHAAPTQADKCLGWGCAVPGDLLRCQLCTHSPTYWRNSRRF